MNIYKIVVVLAHKITHTHRFYSIYLLFNRINKENWRVFAFTIIRNYISFSKRNKKLQKSFYIYYIIK